MSVGGVERDAEELDILLREHFALINAGPKSEELIGPQRVKLKERIRCRSCAIATMTIRCRPHSGTEGPRQGLRARGRHRVRRGGDCPPSRFERFINRIKHFRAGATRYDKHDANFLASVKLAAVRIWMRFDESVI